MGTSIALAVTPRADPKCCAICPYRPSRIAWLLGQIETLAQSGWEPSEALATVLSQDNLPGGAFGPGMRRGLDDVADIASAIKAGKRHPAEIARFLCPFALDD